MSDYAFLCAPTGAALLYLLRGYRRRQEVYSEDAPGESEEAPGGENPSATPAPQAERSAPAGPPPLHLSALDPHFSRLLFLDFAQLLYTRWQVARGSGAFAPVRPYVRADVIRSKSRKDLSDVQYVSIGDARIVDRDAEGGYEELTVLFDATLREVSQHGRKKDYWTVERWTFRRPLGVCSPPPDRMQALCCPNCGAPVELRPDGSCTYCDEVVANGKFGWQVVSMHDLEREQLAARDLYDKGAPPTPRKGSVKAPGLFRELKAFRSRYPEWKKDRFLDFAQEVFLELQRAWSERAWERIRPWETDSVFQTQRHLIERYRQEGLINRVERVRILSRSIVAVERDPFFEAITVRFAARAVDYTIRASTEELLFGSREKSTSFVEYWTFVRRAGCRREPDPKLSQSCPACSAPLRVDAAGVCEHCNAKVVSGEFGWVLSRITQPGPWQDAIDEAWTRYRPEPRRSSPSPPPTGSRRRPLRRTQPPPVSKGILAFAMVALGWLPMVTPAVPLVALKGILKAWHWRLWGRLFGNTLLLSYGLGMLYFWYRAAFDPEFF
ncbi:MAG: hypothetical protein D6731_01605 [Planctomycetota bacterium]|nr:MAG: hypothetical protein D6731_01605 [Planctomycetota bacterium]